MKSVLLKIIVISIALCAGYFFKAKLIFESDLFYLSSDRGFLLLIMAFVLFYLYILMFRQLKLVVSFFKKKFRF